MSEEASNGHSSAPRGGEGAERPPIDPEREARRRRALSMIRTFGDPALKARAIAVDRFDDMLGEEVRRMAALMEDAMGIGLAATQVGIMHRLLVYRTTPDGALVVVVNPLLDWQSDEHHTAEEGCLSLPGVAVDVDRALYARVRGQDESGNSLMIEASGLEARVLQHEIDHLDGVLMIDRATREQRREALRVLREGPAEQDRTPEVSPA